MKLPNRIVNDGKGPQPDMDKQRKVVADYLENVPSKKKTVTQVAYENGISVPRLYRILRDNNISSPGAKK